MWNVVSSPLGRVVVPDDVPPGLAVFMTTLDYPGKIVPEEVTGYLRDAFSIDASLTTCVQVHGRTATRARREAAWRECDSCDALWSDERHTALGIKVADCLPVVLLDPEHHVIANIHAGWRGAANNVVTETLSTVESATAFDAASAHAYLGPSIRACCFEVGEEVAQVFPERYVDRSRPKPHVDLAAFAGDALRARGIAHIHDSGMCTRCDDSIFHSYRRDQGKGGRNLVIVAQ